MSLKFGVTVLISTSPPSCLIAPSTLLWSQEPRHLGCQLCTLPAALLPLEEAEEVCICREWREHWLSPTWDLVLLACLQEWELCPATSPQSNDLRPVPFSAHNLFNQQVPTDSLKFPHYLYPLGLSFVFVLKSSRGYFSIDFYSGREGGGETPA